MAQIKTTARERSADEKLRLITPLLVPGQDKGQLIRAMKEIELRESVSYRSLGWYLRAWEKDGYEGLKPKPPWNSGKVLVKDLPAAVQEAIVLRKECPGRSVKDIIRILEMEGKIQPGSIRRQTLQRHLQVAGYSAKQARADVKAGGRQGGSRRGIGASYGNQTSSMDRTCPSGRAERCVRCTCAYFWTAALALWYRRPLVKRWTAPWPKNASGKRSCATENPMCCMWTMARSTLRSGSLGLVIPGNRAHPHEAI